MLKPEFINSLSYALRELPQQERDKIISYYMELIDDKMESGKPEEEIIAEFGDINTLAGTIISESNSTINEDMISKSQSSPSDRKKLPVPAWLIILLIIFSPFIFAIAVAAFSVALGLLITAFALVFSFFVVSVALGLSGVLIFFTSFIILPTNPTYAVMQLGAGILLTGLSIFAFTGAFYFTKGCVKLSSMTFRGIGKLFSKISL